MTSTESLERFFGSEIKEEVSLGPLTTLGIGGNAEFYFEPYRIEDLVLVKQLGYKFGLPLHIIGGGSNLIIDDQGLKGIVISTVSLKGIEIRRKGILIQIIAETGVQLKRLVGLSLEEGFTGIEFAVGIPGTLGGAVFGNAGVRDNAMSDLVSWVETINDEGEVTKLNRDQIDWGYRYSALSKERCCISRCCLNLATSSRQDVWALSRSFWEKRVHQPYGFKSAGCVFKNPDGDSAGRLLEVAGCKGLRKGDAQVSHFHANFIVNLGNASFSDILWLIQECQRRVKDSFDIDLSLEVDILSDAQLQI